MDSRAEELKKELSYKNESAFKKITDDELERSMAYSEAYKLFLDSCKTEREAVKYAIEMARSNGYEEYRFGMEIEKGGKYYYSNRGKSLFLFRIGMDSVENSGIKIIGAHVDSPRLDLKPQPLYEAGGFGLLKTHYYGGIKKYQWTAVPLALHGVVVKADGTSVDVCIGEDEDDPVFCVSDLLIHLSKDQLQKTLAEGVTGENLNIVFGSEPYRDEKIDEPIKLNLLKILNTKYGIKEEDFISAELTAVPADKARDIGLDRSLIGGYGHDDRCCAYPALTALFDTDNSKETVMVILADKEEIGSEGVSGIQSQVFSDLLQEIAEAEGANFHAVKCASKCLSADVSSAYDPTYADAFEKNNSSYINHGTVICKYTGSRGKSGTSDASAELMAYFMNKFRADNVAWQTGELGKVDQGGGGTIAKFVAQLNIDTLDIGVPVVSMHAPYEIISKLDLYMTYKAFCAFIK